MKTSTIFAPVLTDAVSLSRSLAEMSAAPTHSMAEADELFALLAERIEALPPTVADLPTMVHLRNRLHSAMDYSAAGEFGAAKYELRQLHRKLYYMSV